MDSALPSSQPYGSQGTRVATTAAAVVVMCWNQRQNSSFGESMGHDRSNLIRYVGAGVPGHEQWESQQKGSVPASRVYLSKWGAHARAHVSSQMDSHGRSYPQSNLFVRVVAHQGQNGFAHFQWRN